MCHARPHTSYDIFLSHSGAVKRGIVGWLQDAFRKAGTSCFFDDIALKDCDRAEEIMKTAAMSAKIGIVVLTPCFLTRPWPLLELQLFLSNDDMHVLPIFHTQVPSPPDCMLL